MGGKTVKRYCFSSHTQLEAEENTGELRFSSSPEKLKRESPVFRMIRAKKFVVRPVRAGLSVVFLRFCVRHLGGV